MSPEAIWALAGVIAWTAAAGPVALAIGRIIRVGQRGDTAGRTVGGVLTAACAHYLATSGVGRYRPPVTDDDPTPVEVGASDAPLITLGELPDEPDSVIALVERPGPPADPVHGYDFPEVLILVRHPADQTGAVRPVVTLGEQVQAVMVGTAAATFAPGTPDETWVLKVDARQSQPQRTGTDARGRPLYQLSFTFETLSARQEA